MWTRKTADLAVSKQGERQRRSSMGVVHPRTHVPLSFGPRAYASPVCAARWDSASPSTEREPSVEYWGLACAAISQIWTRRLVLHSPLEYHNPLSAMRSPLSTPRTLSLYTREDNELGILRMHYSQDIESRTSHITCVHEEQLGRSCKARLRQADAPLKGVPYVPVTK
jgi:hypothetical protein